MFTSLKNKTKGFTLIELLVVIAIIGILSSVVLASLSTARQKSRDAKRISDLGQVQVALELLFDATQSYASTTPSGSPALTQLYNLKFLPQVPAPPAGSATAYIYRGIEVDGTTECTTTNTCTTYALGIDLERDDNAVLVTDADQTLGTVFYGLGTVKGAACTTAAGVTKELCYDIKP